jgi:hypothetical protein
MEIEYVLARLGGASSLVRRTNPVEYKAQSVFGIFSILSIILYLFVTYIRNFVIILNRIESDYIIFIIPVYIFLLLFLNQFFLIRINNKHFSDNKHFSSVNTQMFLIRCFISILNGFLSYILIVFIEAFP